VRSSDGREKERKKERGREESDGREKERKEEAERRSDGRE
jgi:hypothetical protein